jgi:hypothetical protein
MSLLIVPQSQSNIRAPIDSLKSARGLRQPILSKTYLHPRLRLIMKNLKPTRDPRTHILRPLPHPRPIFSIYSCNQCCHLCHCKTIHRISSQTHHPQIHIKDLLNPNAHSPTTRERPKPLLHLCHVLWIPKPPFRAEDKRIQKYI